MPSTPLPNNQASVPDNQNALAAKPCIHNRLEEVVCHSNWFLQCPRARLAHASGVSRATMLRLFAHQITPTFPVIWKITRAVEKHFAQELDGKPLDPRELFSLDGAYPTPSACTLIGCPGCKTAHAIRQKQAYRQQAQRQQADQ